MTAQCAERFINLHPRIDVSHLHLYFVSAEPPERPIPPTNQVRDTSLWRGHIATWRLNTDGTLHLLQFEFPGLEVENSVVQVLDSAGSMMGHFTLTFRPFFFGPSTKIPFVDGRVVEDRTRWQIDDQALSADVLQTDVDDGLIISTYGGYAFLPRWLLLNPYCQLETMLGKRLQCEIIGRDDDRDMFLVKELQSTADE